MTGRRAALLGLALVLSGCSLIGGDISPDDLCRGVADTDVRTALGAPDGVAVAFAMESGGCVWSTPSDDGRPRNMRATIRRERDLKRALPPRSGAWAFEDALHALEKDYPRTRVLGGLGDAAVIGFGAIGEDRFAGGLVARKNGDVLTLRIEGDDPAAFEAAARSIADRM
ncbi:MAG: hypothetical protein IV086_11295 [Hyphomonadaceae bacterium]|nr:MAG: hypothetical protein FD160_863 [Caulobacteraceae bacterium]MBT9446275.1 hypothetical protein [Hyphomonadaceae bacterium]TPW08889.1 MAG: hypothetical protein FD124_79 [Alphaproteobacteria bacterium]